MPASKKSLESFVAEPGNGEFFMGRVREYSDALRKLFAELDKSDDDPSSDVEAWAQATALLMEMIIECDLIEDEDRAGIERLANAVARRKINKCRADCLAAGKVPPSISRND